MYITICERKTFKILGKTEDENNYVSGNGLRNGNTVTGSSGSCL